MEYFYTPPPHISSDSLTIDGDEFAHLTHVMRKKAGDSIRVVDGVGNAYDATIVEIAKRTARCRIEKRYQRLHEPENSVTIAAGVLKNSSNFDFLIEKCTELGVSAFIPLFTERTISHHAKTDRGQKLALAAMKQCTRSVLPKVHDAKRFDEFLSSIPSSSLKIIPHEKVESPTIAEVVEKAKHDSIVICIGPEGGFSDEEIAAAQVAGFIPVSLGQRRLRTETAAIVAAAFSVMQQSQ